MRLDDPADGLLVNSLDTRLPFRSAIFWKGESARTCIATR
jgi:hypothetical protein